MQIIYTKLPQTKRKKCIFRMVSCTAVYLVSVGALSSMAGLGWTLFGAWGAGTVLLLALCFLPEQAKIQSIVRLSLFLLLGAAVWFLWEPWRMLVFHMLVWQIIFVLIPDLRQLLGAQISTWDFVCSQGSGNASLCIWMAANAIWAGRESKQRRRIHV